MLYFIELAPGWVNLREEYGEEASNDIYYNPQSECLSFFPVFEKKNLKQAVELFESSLMQGKKLNLSYLSKIKDLKQQAIDLCKQNITWREALDPIVFQNILTGILEIRKHDKIYFTPEKSADSIYNNSGIKNERILFRDINTYFKQNTASKSQFGYESHPLKLNQVGDNDEKIKDRDFKLDFLPSIENTITTMDQEISFGNKSTESTKCKCSFMCSRLMT